MYGLSSIAKLGLPAVSALAGLSASEDAEAGIGGVGAKMADEFMLGIAQKMRKEGYDPQQVFQATRWYKGPDLKWRFEYDDVDTSLAPDWRQKLSDTPPIGGLRLKDIYQNPNFEANYPSFSEGVIIRGEDRPNVLGSWHEDLGIMTISPRQDDMEA